MSASARRRITALRSARTPARPKANLALRIAIALLFVIILTIGGISAAAVAYVQSVKLPPLNPANAIRFENSEILASNHKILYEMVDQRQNTGSRIIKPLELRVHNPKQCPNGTHTQEKKFYFNGVPILTCDGDGIPPILRDATIATEDPTFYSNPGFDPLSIMRAAYQDVTSGQIQSGASTITQQFVKEYILHDTAPTITRKLKEIILAWRMTQKYPKNYILYYYLNSVYYGHLAYGVQAAAETYFHVGVSHLKLWQAAMIAGLPQAPVDYDPFNSSTISGKFGPWYTRMLQVLQYMHQRGYITQTQEANAERQAQLYKFYQLHSSMKQPDFVTYAIDQFAAMTTDPGNPQYDRYLVARLHGRTLNDGLRIITTLRPNLQRLAQQEVTSQVNKIGYDYVTDGALVSINVRPGCYGCLMAMVGTANVDTASVDINMANTPRQPGSSFKVFNYVSAFEKGLAPGTEVTDAPLSIPDNGSSTGYYAPSDYDGNYLGPLSIRYALGNSRNIPAVKVELWNGVQRVVHTAIKFGITDYRNDNGNFNGYATTLGGQPHGVRLIQETAAYGAFATNGIKVPPIAFTEIVDRATGKVLWKYWNDPVLRARRVRVAPAANAEEITSILSDNAARTTDFGPSSYLLLDRPSAAKTGTTSAFKDNWTVGYTPQIVTGVWVGNANNAEMSGSSGITGAAPIWQSFMESAFQILKLPVENFSLPNIQMTDQCRLADGSGGTATFFKGYDVTPVNQKVLPYCTVPGIDTTTYQPVVPTAAPVAPAPVASAPTPIPTQPPAILPSGNGSNPGNGNPPGLLPGNG